MKSITKKYKRRRNNKKTKVRKINKSKRKYFKKQKGGAPGIKIKDTIITSLSGPISFYYLKPKVNINPFEFEYFPLIILFGDRHESIEGSCVNCSCSKEKGKCCYTISDHTFLQLLDTLGDNDNPIDFYTETFLAGTDAENQDDYLGQLISKEMITCYHRTLHGSEYNKCPTKNIRWQATDARVAGDSFGNLNDDGDDNDDYYYYSINKTIEELLDEEINGKKFIDTVSKKFRDNVYIEFQISALLEKLTKIFKYLFNNDIDIDNKKEVTVLMDRFNNLLRKSQFKTIDNFMDLLKTLYNEETNSIDFNAFSETLFSMMTADNSLIYKQIMKQEYPPFKDIKYWSNVYAQALKNKFTDDYKFAENELYYLLEAIEYIDDYINDEEDDYTLNINERYDTIRKLERVIGSPFVDIYTITRILKKPVGGKRSSLSFGYFGHNHVKNMVNILLSTGKYTLVHSVSNKEDKLRCLEFDFSLDLDAELKEHNELIKK